MLQILKIFVSTAVRVFQVAPQTSFILSASVPEGEGEDTTKELVDLQCLCFYFLLVFNALPVFEEINSDIISAPPARMLTTLDLGREPTMQFVRA